MDEMEVEIEINVVDPIGDAAMLLNINPDNMLPLIALMCMYISYGTLMHVSRTNQKKHIERKQAKFLAGEDPSKLVEEVRTFRQSTLQLRVRVQLIRHSKTCTTDIYIQNECAHVGLSIHAPVCQSILCLRLLLVRAYET